MPSLKRLIANKLRAALGEMVPTRPAAAIDTRQEPPALANQMDAGRLMSILAAAEGGYTRDLFALYRDVIVADSHLQSELGKRKLAVLGDALSFAPFDKTAAADVQTAAEVSEAIRGVKGWTRACGALLDATLYPVAVIEKVFRPDGRRYEIAALSPVPHHLLDYMTGRMRIHDVDPATGVVLPTSHEPDPRRYIVHRGHLLTTPDNWGGPMRSILFWWLLSAMNREWWARFLERYGSPFLVGQYPDEEGRSVLERAFSMATRLGGLAVSEGTSVEIKQAAASDSGQAYEKFISLCQREKSKLILGQTLSSEAQPTGLGEGTSSLQAEVRQDIRKFDAASLAETLRDQLIAQYVAINNLPGRPPKLIWGADTQDEVDSAIALLGSLDKAGLEISDAGLAALTERVGLDLRRKAGGPALPFHTPAAGRPLPLSAPGAADDPLAREGAASLAQAFRGSLAPVRRIILDSRSPEECEQRIREFYADWRPERVATLVGEALEAYAANGATAPFDRERGAV